MAGYFNYSMSNNARAAHLSGEFPASKAAKTWGFKSAKALQEKIAPSSWHHTSKFYNRTDFFDIEAAYSDFELSDFVNIWPALNRKGKQIAANYIRDRIKNNLESNSFDLSFARFQSGVFKHRRRKFKRDYCNFNKLIPVI